MKKRTDGRYCTQIFVGHRPDGTRIMKTVYGKTVREVERKEREIRSQIDMGLNISRSITLSEWADEWLETYKSFLSPYTVRRYRSIVNVHIKPNIGKLRVDKVKLSHVQKLLNDLSDYSISSVKKVRDAIHQMYVAAIANELAIKDPTIGATINARALEEKAALSEEEVKLINEYCEKGNAGVFVLTLLYTGMRKGEAMALTWDDIDFDRGVIHITKATVFVNNQPTIRNPKTKNSIRDIPILDNLRTVLWEYKQNCQGVYGAKIGDKNVFLNNLGNPHSESSINRLWTSFLKNFNNYYGTDIKFGMHQLRHTFCTMLYNAGVDIKTAQSILGHSDASVTLRVYTHLSDRQKSTNISKLNEYINQAC